MEGCLTPARDCPAWMKEGFDLKFLVPPRSDFRDSLAGTVNIHLPTIAFKFKGHYKILPPHMHGLGGWIGRYLTQLLVAEIVSSDAD